MFRNLMLITSLLFILLNLMTKDCLSQPTGVDSEYLDQLYKKGAQAIDQGNYDEALNYFQECEKILPSDNSILAGVYDNIGLIYIHKNEISKAIPYFEKAISINPKLPHPHVHLIAAHREQKSYISAISAGLNLFEIEPDTPFAHHELWLTYSQMGGNLGYTREIILREVYHIERILEILPMYRNKELALQELRFLLSMENTITEFNDVSRETKVIPKSISEMSDDEMSIFVESLNPSKGDEIELPEDNILLEKKLEYFKKAKRRFI